MPIPTSDGSGKLGNRSFKSKTPKFLIVIAVVIAVLAVAGYFMQ
jgi:hypothetical protein